MANFLILAHFNGANGSTTITNDNGSGPALVFGGAGALTTSNTPPFGTAWADLTGTNSRAETSTPISLTAPWCISVMMNLGGFTGCMVSIGDENTPGSLLIQRYAGDFEIREVTAGPTINQFAFTNSNGISSNTTQLLTISCDSSNLVSVAVGGDLKCTGTPTNTTFSGILRVGGRNSGGVFGGQATGYYDELAVIDDDAYYTTYPFTPPTSEYTIGSGATTTTATAAAGVATVSGAGASTAATGGTGAGNATVAGAGASTAATTATAAAGAATVSAVGAAVFITTATAASGVATVSGAAQSTAATSGQASGVATVSGAGASRAATSGQAAGAATVSGTGASAAATNATPAAGSATVSAVGDSVDAGQTTAIPAEGVATVSAQGSSIVATTAVPAQGSSEVSATTPTSGGGGYDDAKRKARKRVNELNKKILQAEAQEIAEIAVTQAKSAPKSADQGHDEDEEEALMLLL